MLDILKAIAREGIKFVEKHDFVRIFTHYDPDGITAGAIIATALIRLGKDFQVRFLKGLNEEVEYDKDDLVILSDMGSGYPDVVSKIEADTIVVDHHIPTGRIEKDNLVHINPHLAGLDGTYELSASGTAYVFANVLGDNRDLAGIALVGAIGDKQKMKGGNAEILREGIESGYIEVKSGLSLHSMKVREALMLSLEPFLDFYGKEDELEDFLRKVRIDGDKDFEELSDEEMYRLSNAVALRLLKMNAYTGVFNDIMRGRIILKSELIRNAVTMCDVINACGRVTACSLGFALCLRDSKYLNKAFEIWRNYTTELLERINAVRDDVREGFCIRYVIMSDGNAASPIATIFSRYFYPDKPFIAVSVKGERAKVSARGNDSLKVNLAEVMQKAGEKVGGRGGGHRVAAGAIIPADKVEEFISEVDRLCCSQG
ncbi:single-stranded-DNA-specific exonuclease RecJ [Archaeoglobus profundus]|uniref:Phosphoesterase RecJ domain protein n=1 Tax=Archaeoglobus profundus (strain DSM 5631 / JCM 9629 / NBRC 100127 / Av18) TaxID=572546 RepID=D2RDK0_ARCPA|nr:DHH family phosphoesterase [Archaeoglobus profundus]ADB58194.1 phosphoesterase RecJ domain protein [Archaeoglobus profundus DSM 5631]